jgi:hypothetical protein
VAPPTKSSPVYLGTVGVLVVRVGPTSLTPIGLVSHPVIGDAYAVPAPIERSMIINGTLWTVSEGGLLATDPDTLAQRGWVSLS